MVYSFAPNDEPLYVSEGDYVQFRFRAPNDWSTTRTVTIQIGDLVQYWYITTIPEDFTPDPFPFQNVNDAELDTLYTYADGSRPGESITTITGLTPGTNAAVALGCNLAGGIDVYAMRIDYDGNGTWDTGWIQGDGTQTVQNDARIQVRAKTSEFIVQYTRLTLVVGTSSEQWRLLTRSAPVNEPSPFPQFTDLEDQPTNTYCYSEVIRVQGLDTAAEITTSNPGEWAVSSTNTTSTNDDGFDVLSGVTFSAAAGTISNGVYLQLRMLSSSNALTTRNTNLSIGDAINGDTWSVETGNNPSTNPTAFQFTSLTDQLEDTLIASDQQPAAGITGLGEGISVPVTVISTDASVVRVKKNNGSIGVFPTTVSNGDKLVIYLQSSASYNDVKSLQIQVGDLTIPTWEVQTNAGPDTDADFTPPPNKNNQIPSSFVSSAPITVSGINRPITIEVIAGYDALISIDFDTPVVGPRTFDPSVNTSFYIVVQAADQLNTPETTTIRLGTGDPNSFQWQVRTYVTVPPPATNLGKWYSKKTDKFDGYAIGTVLPVLKESVGSYGDLDGGIDDRYPGFVPCDGRQLDKNDYFSLYEVIGGEYGETTNDFNVPDYRNRRLCGVGFVDGQKGNSAGLPVSTSGKGINDPGAEGGYWYFEKVGARGSLPLDQVQGSPSIGGSLDSDYFSLGTVRINGLSTIEDTVLFDVNPSGFVIAQIGPLSTITVRAPEHSHAFVSAEVEGDGGSASIPWEDVTLFETAPTGPDVYDAGNAEQIRQRWATWLQGIGSFYTEWQKYYGTTVDFTSWVNSNFPANWSVNEEINVDSLGNGGTDFGAYSDDNDDTVLSFMLWWCSPVSGVDGAILQSREGQNAYTHAGVFDTQSGFFTIDQYLNTGAGGATKVHNHLITEDPIGNLQVDFTGGNFDGPGSNAPEYGSGLGGGVDGGLLTFNMRYSAPYVSPDGTPDPDSSEGGASEGAWIPATLGTWGYRNGGNSYWTSPTGEVTDDYDMIGGSGTGMRLRMTFQAWPNPGGSSANDTRIRVDQILDSGQGYSVGDQLSVQFWDDIPGTANRIIQISNVSSADSGGAGETIQVAFTQSDIFMDLSPGLFKYSSSFKRPIPDIIMRPQRQVPILNPFHKTKYIIKAY